MRESIAAPPELVIRSTRVVLPDGVSPATIHCEGGRIRRIGAYDEPLPASVLQHLDERWRLVGADWPSST